MAIQKTQVQHVAELAQLKLTSSELEKYTKQLSEIIDYDMGLLNKIETDGIEPTAQVTGLEDVTQNDNPRPSLDQKEALKNVPETEEGYFKTGVILEQ
ncbi:MAG: Asp-tRNA(Asn)/Glu-tRNA(Gln) amidotransferase subunit GatC [Patescibacteria group bacterium]|nr:Asp-tRNA(Asn)/Glu-tRNA(Gln) amidotransferase subunit GatC [Patescibacteria group bacterium]